ncbi:helix-turn-helix domain-containing protein [Halobacillus faecis]
MKDLRKNKNKTQQQLAVDMFQSREYISKQEGGERKIPPVSTKYFIEKYNNPWLALEAVNEYVGWGVSRLEGPEVEEDNFLLQLLLEEELQKAINVLANVNLTAKLHDKYPIKIHDIRKSAEIMTGVIHFSTLYLATVCERYEINWLKLWKDHHQTLYSKRLLN